MHSKPQFSGWLNLNLLHPTWRWAFFPNDPHVVVYYFVLSFLPGVTILSLANLTTCDLADSVGGLCATLEEKHILSIIHPTIHGTWKWWFPKGISFSMDFFSGSMLKFQGCTYFRPLGRCPNLSLNISESLFGSSSSFPSRRNLESQKAETMVETYPEDFRFDMCFQASVQVKL